MSYSQSPNPQPAGDGALAGVRVLDLTHFVAGPAATMALAFMGAEIIKVERPGVPRDGAFRRSVIDVNKKSITLDLKSAAGKQTALDLAKQCDVFIENFSPGVIDRLGLDYETVSAVNPRIIYAQVKGYASDSPYAGFPCFEPAAQAFAGSTSFTGMPDGPPIKPGPDLADNGSGLLMAMGITAALYQRQRTGRGQHIEVAMTDHVSTFIRIHYGWPIDLGQPTPRPGNWVPFTQKIAPAEAYPCKPFGPNDWLFMHVSSNAQWHGLLKVIGREELKDDPRFASPLTRGEHRNETNQVVSEWLRGKTKIEAMEALCRAGVPAGAVRDTQEVLNDADLRRRGIFVTVNDPERGEITIPGWPIATSEGRLAVRAAPTPGAHNGEVLGGLLGLSEEQIRALTQPEEIAKE
ncbi:MAG: CoA transferase [Chloroflexota bacterium]|nr:CoA transferase [Chloroflexota bacterium]